MFSRRFSVLCCSQPADSCSKVNTSCGTSGKINKTMKTYAPTASGFIFLALRIYLKKKVFLGEANID